MHSTLHILPHVPLMMPLEPASTYSGTTVQPDAFTSFSNLLYFAFLHAYDVVRVRSKIRVRVKVNVKVLPIQRHAQCRRMGVLPEQNQGGRLSLRMFARL